MHRFALLALLAGVVAFGACSSEEGDDDDGATTTTGVGGGTPSGSSPSGSPSGTASGSGGSGGGTGTGTASGGGGQGGASPHPECAAVSGICTDARWMLCPSGMEPVDPDPNQDCPGDGGTQGWCCVDAPPSTCSDDSSGNCIVGSTCDGCWADVPNYDCEYGRVCCQDICD